MSGPEAAAQPSGAARQPRYGAGDSSRAGERGGNGAGGSSGSVGGSSSGSGVERSGRAAARAAAIKACRFDRRLHLFSLLLHGAAQAATLSAWSALPAAERAQRLLSIALVAAYWLLPAAAPELYLRWRTLALAALRIAFFSFPLLRKARGIQKVLEADPQPGARGAAKDLLKVVWGSRLVAVALAALVNPLPMLPLVPHLLLQLYSVAMVRQNSTLCAAPLLAHPTTAARISRFHVIMQLLTTVLPGGSGQVLFPRAATQANSASQAEAMQAAECEAFLTFLAVCVGLVLPIALVIKTEPRSSLARWEAACEAPAQHNSCTSSASICRRLCHACHAAASVLEATLRHLCGRSWLAPPRTQHGDGVDVWEGQPEDWGLQQQEEQPEDWGTQQQEEQHMRQASGPADQRRCARRWRLQGWEQAMAWWLMLSLLWAFGVALAAV